MTDASNSSTKVNDPHAFSITCSNCGAVHVNDSTEICHALDYIAACRKEGWHIPEAGGTFRADHRCPKCASSL